MAVDRYGNAVIKKDFWADGGWYTVFFLLPVFAGWVVITIILIYGTYATFRYEPQKLQAGFLFIVFAFLFCLAAIPLFKSVWTLLSERIIFTNERIIYLGFGSYSLPYKSIKRVTLREWPGPFGAERFLFFVASDSAGKERLYLIPRWKTLAQGALTLELSRHMTLNLLDRGLLSFYAVLPGRDWWLPAILSAFGAVLVFSFLAARISPEQTASVVVFFWLIAISVLIFILARYLGRKKEVTLPL